MKPKNKYNKIRPKLKKEYGEKRTALRYKNPFQLLISVILSAQATDAQVNKATPALFKKYPDAESLAEASQEEVEKLVYSTGFYKSKAKRIRKCAQMLVEKYDGKIPDSMKELTKLPGVARKTANVVLSEHFNKKEGIVVDTHVKRVSKRLGLTKEKNPVKVEQDLMEAIPKKDWINIGSWLIWHGRKYCDAKKPKCGECPLNKDCPSAFKFKHFN